MNRLRMMQVLTLLLYLGPLLAGMAGFGWNQVAAFSVIFLLWQIVMRPLDWPRDPAAWRDGAMLAAAAARIAILVALVAILFGLGRGIGGIAGYLPAVPVLAPLGLSLLAVPLARMVWDPAKAAEMDRFLDGALAQVKAKTADAAHINAATARADALLQPLADLPADTPAEAIEAHLRAMGAHVDPARLREALLARVRGGAGRPLTLALALHASDPGMLATVPGRLLTDAWLALPDDAGVISAFAHRMAAALQASPALWWDLPTADLIAARAARLSGTEAEHALMSLVAAADRLAQRGEG